MIWNILLAAAGAVLLLAVLLLIAARWACHRALWVNKAWAGDLHRFIEGKQYEPFYPEMRVYVDALQKLPRSDVSVTAEDGFTIWGRYFESAPGNPLVLMFHGYRSDGQKDFAGAVPWFLNHGFNCVIAEQRAHGRSDGKYLTFGVLERRDCLCWARWAEARYPETPVILMGLSMGAATVLMASDLPLPEAVKGIVADCGYSSPKDIICSVMGDTPFARKALFPLLNLGSRIYAKCDLTAASAEDSLTRCTLPVLILHGEDDRFVPISMTHKNYQACASDKTLFTVPGAPHGLSYMVDKAGYEKALAAFLDRVLGN